MKWSYVLAAVAFIGVFSLGAWFSPIEKSSATVNDPKLPVVQTTNEKEPPQQGQAGYSCRMNGGQMGSGAGMRMMGSMNEVIADALGMSREEFQTARHEGKSVADLAKDKEISVDQLLAFIIETRKANLEKLVKDGKLTQEQMDSMLENMTAMMKEAIERNTTGPMHGSGKGMGYGGRWSQQTQTNSGSEI
ncbi:YckD family protein [Neobacillus niacini]|uniref:YckD family protein n=1 Tax=Neobacillus niacini TaxID=86668 RepID=UPI0021CB7167|nr:YckD family protein [Neobacillus niacini]MCM3764578.1 YckD family protein [Neobacillus niacini]